MRLAPVLVFLVSTQACSSTAPSSTHAPIHAPITPPPARIQPVQAPIPSVAQEDRGCEVGVRTSVVPLGGGRFELVATAANETDHPIDTVMLYGCPGWAARFDGLPSGYDVGDLCRMGACPQGPSTRTPLVLAPFGTQEIARVTIETAGDECNAALAPGRYSIGATVTLQGAQACSTSRAVLVSEATPAQAPTTRRTRREPPAPPHPAPARENCPVMACAYTPCPPGVEPPTGCASVCGCSGSRGAQRYIVAPP